MIAEKIKTWVGGKFPKDKLYRILEEYEIHAANFGPSSSIEFTKEQKPFDFYLVLNGKNIDCIILFKMDADDTITDVWEAEIK